MNALTLRGVAAQIFVVLLTLSTSVSAQTQSHESRVVGWSASGAQILVRTEHQGELAVDGESQTFYFETIDVYSSQSGSKRESYRAGEFVGAEHPDWKSAKATGLDLSAMQADSPVWTSPNGRYFVSAFNQSRKEDGGCTLRERIVVFDKKAARTFVVQDTATREDTCSHVSYVGHWQPTSARFAVERKSKDSWTLIVRDVAKLDALEDAPFKPWDLAESVFLSARPNSALAPTWKAIFGHDLSDAMQTVGQVSGEEESSALIVRFLVLALKGVKKEAYKGAKSAYKKSAKSPLDEAVLAAVYMAAGNKRGSKHIKSAAKRAKNFVELVQMGAMFSLVDLSLSNQLLINALSHETAQTYDTTPAYELLIEGLIDAGEYDTAADVIKRFEKPTPVLRALDLHLGLIRNSKKAKREALDLTFDEPGQCVSYALAAQATAASNPALALQHFRAAAFCDPHDAESQFYLGDFAIRRGELAAARGAFKQFLQNSPSRRHDPVRDVRRAFVVSMLPRLAYKGVVLLRVSCRGVQCSGTLINAGNSPAKGIVVKAIETRKRRKKEVKKRQIGATELPELAPGEVASFRLTLVDNKAKTMLVSAGKTPDEHELNLTRPKP